jgi:CRISPR system Cascade subunit CasA
MQFNLIDEKWIPVKRKDGTPDTIRPWEVTDGFDENPIVGLNAPRPDFNAALIQFLIGLVQTTIAPANKIEWKKKLQIPPTPNELKASFMKVRPAFELAGEGPRFMQDFDELIGQAGSIDGLLIDEPGENALKNNTDFFVKRKQDSFSMCPACCAAAIFSLQTNAPAGGRGYMTSLRGGGPLTTLVIGSGQFDTLWHTAWLNVLESNKFRGLANSSLAYPCEKFPWLAKTKANVTERQIHPAQYFWATPRRIKLTQENSYEGKCDVCSCESNKLISQYIELPNGTKYQEPMKHPLSAFNRSSTKAVLTQPGGVNYRHWLGLVVIDSDSKNEPARVVHEFIQERQERDSQFRLWAFGYDFVPGQNKARCWYESTMPLLHIEQSMRGEFEGYVAGMVKAAAKIAFNARAALKKAWFKRPGDAKGDVTFVDNSFWHQTESVFYETLGNLRTSLESGTGSVDACQVWHKTLCEQALKLFDGYAWNSPIEDGDPKRVVTARKELQMYNHSKNIKELLGMSVEKSPSGKRKSKKS